MSETKGARAVAVLGVHRSGTSAVAGVVNAMGVYLGNPADLMKPLAHNPEGFWEHERIVSINDRVFEALGRTWDTALPMPEDWWARERFAELRSEAVDLVRSEFAGHALWGWKDPRTALLLPFWTDVLAAVQAAPVYVVAIRHPLDVAGSLQRRDAFALDKSLALWVEHVLRAFEYSEGAPRTVILYDELIDRPDATLNRLRNFLASVAPPARVAPIDEARRALRPALRHHRAPADASTTRERMPALVEKIYELAARAANESGYAQSAGFGQALAQLRQEWSAAAWLMKAAVAPAAQALHVLWARDQEAFSEAQSVRCPLIASAKARAYEFTLPGEARSLRIDPGHRPARIDIMSIEVEEGAPAAKRAIDLAHLRKCVDGETLVREEAGRYSLLALGHDPHIVLRDAVSGDAAAIKLRVTLRVTDHIPLATAALIRSILKQAVLDVSGALQNESSVLRVASAELRDALQQAQSLALGRMEEIQALTSRLQQAEALALGRMEELHALTAQLRQTDAVLREVEALALGRMEELHALTAQLRQTDAALREAQEARQRVEEEFRELRETLVGRVAALFSGRMRAKNRRA